MADTELIMGAIKSLEKLTEAKFKAADQKQDTVIDDIKRHGEEIGQLFNFDRDRSKEISGLGQEVVKLDKVTQPAVTQAKNKTKINMAFVLGIVGVAALAIGDKIVEFIKGNGGN